MSRCQEAISPSPPSFPRRSGRAGGALPNAPHPGHPTGRRWQSPQSAIAPHQAASVGMGMATRPATSGGGGICSRSPWAGSKGSSWPGMSQQDPTAPRFCSVLSRLPARPAGKPSSLQNSPAAEARGCWECSGRGCRAWGHLPAPPPHPPSPPPCLASAQCGAPEQCPSPMPFQPGSRRSDAPSPAFTQMFPGDGEGCCHLLLRGALSTQQGLPA